jgi:quercetin dioxygenase-like cupin family protein
MRGIATSDWPRGAPAASIAGTMSAPTLPHAPVPEPARPTRLMVDEGHGIGNDLEIRRVVTGHDVGGRAVVAIDGPAPKSAFGVVAWSTAELPADNTDPADGGLRPVQITSGGSVIRVMTIPPGTHSYMHRTVSLDFGIVLEGRLDLELDEGRRVTLQPTDIVVQRGTVHAWINPYDAPCKVVFVILPAQPVMIGGQPLPPTHG